MVPALKGSGHPPASCGQKTAYPDVLLIARPCPRLYGETEGEAGRRGAVMARTSPTVHPSPCFPAAYLVFVYASCRLGCHLSHVVLEIDLQFLLNYIY